MAVNNSTEFQKLVQKDFQASIMTVMSLSAGGQLVPVCEMKEIKGAESTTFNRITKDGIAVSTAPQLLGGAGTKGTGLETGVITVAPDFLYAYEQVTAKDFHKSQVSLNGFIPQSLMRQIERAEDRAILLACHTDATVQSHTHAIATALSDAATVQEIIGKAKGMIVRAGDTPDKRKFVKMVMSVKTYEQLYSHNFLINSDYIGQSGTNSASVSTFYGCEVVIIKDTFMDNSATPVEILPTGTFYFIPSMTIGAARWANSTVAQASYDALNEDKWSFYLKKSFAAAVLEGASVLKVTTK